MNKVISRLISFILFFILMAALLLSAACAKEKSPVDNEGAETGTSAEITETTTAPPYRVEFEGLDLGNRDFIVLYSDHPIGKWIERDVYAEKEDGTLINDAVYKRNRNVEGAYNLKIKEIKTPYGGVAGEISKRVNAGDNEVDAALIYLNGFADIASKNMLIEYKKMVNIDLTNPWWDQNSVQSLSLCNKLFAACSDYTIYDKGSTSAMVFNKKLITDYNLGNPYEMVEKGEWTLEKLAEMSKGIAQDIDGNTIYDDKDRYGLIYNRDSFMSFLNGCGEYLAKKDEDDRPYMTINSEKSLSIINYLFDLLYDQKNYFHANIFFDKIAAVEPYTDGMSRMFREDKTLFLHIYMNEVESLRNMETDFGILPMPKYSKEQAEYYSNVNPYVGAAIIFPQTCKSIEESSAIIEALSCEGKYILQPAFYDLNLSTKLTRDEESSKMLDIIFKNRIFDNGDIYNFSGIASDYIFMTMTYDKNFVSKYEKKENAINNAIERMITNFEKTE